MISFYNLGFTMYSGLFYSKPYDTVSLKCKCRLGIEVSNPSLAHSKVSSTSFGVYLLFIVSATAPNVPTTLTGKP